MTIWDVEENDPLKGKPSGWAVTKESVDFELHLYNSLQDFSLTVRRPPGTLVKLSAENYRNACEFEATHGFGPIEVWASPIEMSYVLKSELVFVDMSVTPFDSRNATYAVDSRKYVGKRWQQMYKSSFHFDAPTRLAKKRIARSLRNGTHHK